MRSRSLAAAALLSVLLAARPAHAGDATGAFAPYEDLVEVVADLTWHLKDDVYRFPPPRDPTGHDLYRLTLDRLESWEKRFPGRLRDVTTFARAEVLERLGEYATATAAYRQVAAMASPLAEPARDGAARAADFAAAAALPEDGRPDVAARLAALKAKLEAWSRLIERYTATPFEPLALVEEERLERLTAMTIVTHRHLIDDGDATAERSLRFLIEKHADSKNFAAHILRLGDLYADFAREYVEQHRHGLTFDEDEFLPRADRALQMYRKVATWDGSPEKPQGQGRFTAFDAWKTAVLARYR